MDDWTEVKISIPVSEVERAEAIATMVVPYGIYIEDYSTLEQEAMEIAHIDLIDEELLKKDRNTAIIHVYISPEESPAEAIAFLSERFKSEGIENVIDTSLCMKEDWENNWKQYFHPIPVGNKLLIRPVWEQEFEPCGRAVLNLEPGLAFGTGTHETTRLCLETLEKYVSDDTTLLDIGCGSGILSIAALLLGAKNATGVDIDPLAVKTAEENGHTNNLGQPELTVLQGNLTDKVSGKFSVVVANIVADIIISLCKDVESFMQKDAVFITSGIIDTRENDVLMAFEKYGFSVIERRSERGWVCFVCKRCGEIDA